MSGFMSAPQKMLINGQAPTTALKDWNAPANTIVGYGPYLLKGDDPNGPNCAGYFYVQTFQYGDGSAYGSAGVPNLTQVATPYFAANDYFQDGSESVFVRSRFMGVWKPWRRLLNDYDQGPAFEYLLTGWASNTATTVAHGLGKTPDRTQISFVCKTANNGWAVGDEIDVGPAYYFAHQIWCARNLTDLKIIVRSVVIVTPDGTTAFTPLNTDWDIKVKAYI